MEEKKSYLSDHDKFYVGAALRGGNYGWEEGGKPEKKVILTNPSSLKDVRIQSYVSAFRGTGHAEWECLLGVWMIEAVGKSLDTGEECDITKVFNTTFLAKDPSGRNGENIKFTKEQVYEHIIKFFTILEDSEDVMKVAIKVA